MSIEEILRRFAIYEKKGEMEPKILHALFKSEIDSYIFYKTGIKYEKGELKSLTEKRGKGHKQTRYLQTNRPGKR